MNEPAIEALTFDAAGTLIHLAESVGTTYSAVANEHGHRSNPVDVDRAFGSIWKATPDFAASAAFPDERSWWRSLVLEVFEEAGYPWSADEDYQEYFAQLYDHFAAPGTWLADPDAVEVLERVSASLPCLILSNFDGRLRSILRDTNLSSYFQGEILSCELGFSKPDRRIFAAASASLETDPERILHVGDDPERDWAGAEKAGFRVFRTGRKGRPLRDLLGELSLA